MDCFLRGVVQTGRVQARFFIDQVLSVMTEEDQSCHLEKVPRVPGENLQCLVEPKWKHS